MNIEQLKDVSKKIRLHILDMINQAQSSHIGSAFSMVEILTVLYFKILNLELIKNKDKNRDYFILSKGHSVVGLYATLAEAGLIPFDILKTYYKDDSYLAGHPIKDGVLGVEASTGSLGHGLPIAVGLAIACKKDNLKNKIYVLLGDGELQEGSIWESLIIASRFQLNNLTIVVDSNKIQAFDRTDSLVLGDWQEKFQAFGCNVKSVNGHNLEELAYSFEFNNTSNLPNVIIANTIKGYGVSFMQNKLEWHYKSPNNYEYLIAGKEIELL